MAEEQTTENHTAAERVIELEGELEASGVATLDATGLASARAQLHTWIDSVTGVVVSPALGRVTLLHANGRQSTIGSADLPFAMSAPVRKPTA